MADDTDALLEATTALVPPLLMALDGLACVGRHLHPPELPRMVAAVRDLEPALRAGLATFSAARWPEHLQGFVQHLCEAAEETLEAYASLERCLTQSNPVMGAYRAMGYNTRAVEALYPVSFMLPPVSRFFLTRTGGMIRRRRQGLRRGSGPGRGRHHSRRQRTTERGGFSLYVPEYYEASRPLPLVVALHGGSGHGRSFLWTWLHDARTREVILVSVSSTGDTWSLMGPDIDSANLGGHCRLCAGRAGPWTSSRMLLTGMSDGGTFSYVSGLRRFDPSPISRRSRRVFIRLLLEAASRQNGCTVCRCIWCTARWTGCSRLMWHAWPETRSALQAPGCSTRKSTISPTPIRANRMTSFSTGCWICRWIRPQVEVQPVW